MLFLSTQSSHTRKTISVPNCQNWEGITFRNLIYGDETHSFVFTVREAANDWAESRWRLFTLPRLLALPFFPRPSFPTTFFTDLAFSTRGKKRDIWIQIVKKGVWKRYRWGRGMPKGRETEKKVERKDRFRRLWGWMEEKVLIEEW